MIDNYIETPASGVTWRRCNGIFIENTYGKTPVIRFSEEKVFDLDGAKVMRPTLGCATLFDPDSIISVIDPETSEPTGETITHAEVYRILHSAYLHAALARDAEEAAESE